MFLQVIVVIYIIAFLAYAVYLMAMETYTKFDHSFIPSTPLKSDAKIVDTTSEQVRYMKNGAKYKTNVVFSDGFIFTTYKTKRKVKNFTYYIFIDNELAMQITELAIKAHTKAYDKQHR